MKSSVARVFSLALLFGCVSALHAQSSDSVLYTRATLKDANGEAIFHNICQGCHMPDAKGATGAGTYPALAGNPKLVSASYMAAVILFGRHDMPSFVARPTNDQDFNPSTTLTDAQIADVINYVRTHFGNHYTDSITADEVKAMHPQDNSPKPKS
jgi:mono/diheme cytochrome c family protein